MPINIPKIITRAWASLGSRFEIPENADSSTGRAGYAQGFSEINRTPLEAGGIPPWGQDMNGVLYDLSSAIQYQQSGVLMPFNSAFATAIGGYAVGAIVSDSADNSILWINGTANNLAHPAGWAKTSIKQATETIQGTARIATQAEVNAGALDTVFVTPKKVSAAFGLGQTLQDVTAIREAGVTYTNTTSRPIALYVNGASATAGDAFVVVRVGVNAGSIADACVSRSPVAPGGIAAFAIVPPGGAYAAGWVGISNVSWREMR